MEELYTVNEIAEILKLGISTVRDMAENGSLPMFKIGRAWRIRKSVFEAWLTGKETDNGRCIRKESKEMVFERASQRKTGSSLRGDHKIGCSGRFERVPEKKSA